MSTIMGETPRFYPDSELEIGPEAIALLGASLGPAFEGFMNLPDAPLRYLAAFLNLPEGQQLSLSGLYRLEGGPVRTIANIGRELAASGMTQSR